MLAVIAPAVNSVSGVPAAGASGPLKSSVRTKLAGCVKFTVPVKAKGSGLSKLGAFVKEIVWSEVWSNVPPSSITSLERANAAAPHLVMSSVPPAWMITGTGWDEIARCGYGVEAVESITTVPPKISTPLSIRWSV